MRQVYCKYCNQSFLTSVTGEECPLCKKSDGLLQSSNPHPSDEMSTAGEASSRDEGRAQKSRHATPTPVKSTSAAILEQVPAYKLYSSRSVALASLLTIVGVAIVLAINYKRLSRPIRAIVISVALGVPGTVLDLYLIYWNRSLRGPFGEGVQAVFVDVFMSRYADGTPMPFSALWLVRVLAVSTLADMLQGRSIINHEFSGGKLDSWWKALTIGWLAMFAVGALSETGG